MLTTVAGDGLIEDGDHLMVAVSGGKDSYTLLDLVHRAMRKAPIRYTVTAVHLDQTQPGYDGTPLRAWLEDSGISHEILKEDTYTAVAAEMEAGGTSCRLCSRLRRGILYTAAEKLGCNKSALGHHRDDALETLLMNLFYSGRLQAMPAKYTTNDGRFQVIRPLIECSESDIADYASRMEFPILPCNLCGSQTDLKRQRVGELIAMLEKETPDIRSVMLAALKNVRPSHLLDNEVREAWLEAAGRFEERK
jgi:tRNA 2-thiocytidine biosynthesis protein TtcA